MAEEKLQYADIICPFFLKWRSTSVTCEGIGSDVRCVTLTFDDSVSKDFFAKHNCCRFDPKCGIYSLLQKKYM